MDLHEYQAKKLLEEFGAPIPDFAVVSNPQEIENVLKEKGWKEVVVKVQVLAGGRGKAGGVKIGKTKEEILSIGRSLIGKKIITPQTGKNGLVSHLLLLTQAATIQKEYYLAISINREQAKIFLIASFEGGMDIEEIARHSPQKLLQIPISLEGSVEDAFLEKLLKFMGWEERQGKELVVALAKAFVKLDATLLEINPLALTKENKLECLDAKLSVDDNALFRQPKVEKCFDPSQLTLREVRAREFDLSYVAMEGNIGCMVNGAGLAMATMDIIHYFGGSPANFLDVGGGATEDRIAEGFKIILSDQNVRAVLVNIFGGIMNCAVLAKGILSAVTEHKIEVPLIVRMEGTNVEEGKKILSQSGLNIILANTLDEAAKLAVKAANGYLR